MLRDRGFSVYIVPEAATLIFTSGGKLDMSKWSESEIIKFQVFFVLLKYQKIFIFLDFIIKNSNEFRRQIFRIWIN